MGQLVLGSWEGWVELRTIGELLFLYDVQIG